MPLIAGVDEAGRGPLAGPVVAAAVILSADEKIAGLADSKQLSAKRRASLAETIRKKALYWSIAQASVEEIDNMNILNATLLAMRRAIDDIAQRASNKTLLHALIDGNRVPPGLACTAAAIIKGDQTEPSISAASILAKTYRDQLMIAVHDKYPDYGFAAHKGYGTRVHLQALEKLGPIVSIHRRSFAPVRRLWEHVLLEHKR